MWHRGVVGLEPDRRAEFGEALLAAQGIREVVVRDGVVGPLPDRLAPRGDGGFIRLLGLLVEPLLVLQETTQEGEIPGARSQSLQVKKHVIGLVKVAAPLEVEGKVEGRLGADCPGGGVEANGFVVARELFKHQPQRVVDPDVTRMLSLGGPQHRLGQGLVAGIAQAGP